MIISVSRRTDIPAFFGNWFINRIKEGYFYSVNPFNPNNTKRVSLLSPDVDAIVFWTKNPSPFVKHLNVLNDMGYRYYFQYTMNGYNKTFEPKLPALKDRIDSFKALSDRIGAKRVLWRYDPIIISSITPLEYHLDRISHIASQLKGYTECLTISFMDYYGKVEPRINKIIRENNIVFSDIASDEYRYDLMEFCRQLSNIAGENDIKVFSCAEKIDLEQVGIKHGSCIDVNLINELFNLNLNLKKDSNQREGCLCAKSVDMGAYNTCSFQCAYCYANLSEKTIQNNLKRHRPSSAVLIGELIDDGTVSTEEENENAFRQITIFE